MKIGDKMRWVNARPGSWTGEGRCEIVGYEEQRPYFPGGRSGTKDSPPTGPAVCIKLSTDKAHTVWVSPDELMPDLEAVA